MRIISKRLFTQNLKKKKKKEACRANNLGFIYPGFETVV